MSFLDLASRPSKPRRTGITSLLDPGLPLGAFRDLLKSHGQFVDFVKLGWGTAIIEPRLREKIEIARRFEVEPYLGGTLFEKAVVQGKTEAFRDFVEQLGLTHVEVSNGTIDMSAIDKAQWVERFAKSFTVLSEVGYKDTARSLQMHPSLWVEEIRRDLASGAQLVVTESRESGTSGICRADGEVRYGLIEELLAADLQAERLLFEAPNKDLQVYFLQRVGAQVNLGNIAPKDVLALETLRLGLRSDTLLTFET